MEIKYDQLNFKNVNSQKEFSLKTKIVAVMISVLFLMIPLYQISPETFQKNEIIRTFFDMGCLIF